MECPHCQTENREDRETCYVCGKDISTLRLLVNKARQHYNDALEHAERGRNTEAIDELKHSLDLDASLVNAHVVLGTLYAREGKFDEARECWMNALQLNPEMARAHDYLERVEGVQVALPTLSAYRWVSVMLLLGVFALAALLIYATRPDPGSSALQSANQLIRQGHYGKALDEIERARILADPDGPVNVAAESLQNTMRFDLQQRIRLIQDLKYQQLYPEALAEMAALEAASPDEETSAALSTIRNDISYYYRNLLSQLYASYEQGDLDFETLQSEIERFTSLYPDSPERSEIIGYLERAESMEVQTALEELRRRFAMDNNLQTVVEGLRELNSRFENSPVYEEQRKYFVEETLSNVFNIYTGYLEKAAQNASAAAAADFDRATAVLADVESVSEELKAKMGVEISTTTLELAHTVFNDALRQHQFKQIEKFIADGDMDTAEEAVWQLLQEPNLSPVELDVIRSYWRQITRVDRVRALNRLRRNDSRYFNMEISEEEASRTLELYEELKETKGPVARRIHLLGLAAASALRLNADDQATSYAEQLKALDEDSTVTKAVERLVRDRREDKEPPAPTPVSKPSVLIEPARPDENQQEDPPSE